MPPSHRQKNGFKGPINNLTEIFDFAVGQMSFYFKSLICQKATEENNKLGGDTIAKDGTYRGGRRVKAGGKAIPVAEKIQNGKQAKLMSNDIPELEFIEVEPEDLPDGIDLEGYDMPRPSDYLSAKQKSGIPLGADEIYKETWLWLKERKCEKLVNKRLIESYAQAFARYIQCEDAISKYGMLGKHPTTGGVISSPFIQMSSQFQKTANLIWYEIYDIVKQNCTEIYEEDSDDLMEQLLRRRR